MNVLETFYSGTFRNGLPTAYLHRRRTLTEKLHKRKTLVWCVKMYINWSNTNITLCYVTGVMDYLKQNNRIKDGGAVLPKAIYVKKKE